MVVHIVVQSFLFPVCLASELILEDNPKETVLFEINSPASVHGRFFGDLHVAVTELLLLSQWFRE